MNTSDKKAAPETVGDTTPSRPGIKFVLCVVAAVIVVAVVIIRG